MSSKNRLYVMLQSRSSFWQNSSHFLNMEKKKNHFLVYKGSALALQQHPKNCLNANSNEYMYKVRRMRLVPLDLKVNFAELKKSCPFLQNDSSYLVTTDRHLNERLQFARNVCKSAMNRSQFAQFSFCWWLNQLFKCQRYWIVNSEMRGGVCIRVNICFW